MKNSEKTTKEELIEQLELLKIENKKLKDENANQNQIEADLPESKELYKRLIENTSEGLMLVDIKGVIIGVNQALCDMLGYSREMFIGKEPFYFVEDKSHDKLNEQISLSKSIKHRKYEIHLKKSDNSNVLTLFNATSLFNKKGEVSGSFAFVTDISERKRVEEELKENEKKFRGLFDGMSAGVVFCEAIYDDTGNMIDCTFLDMNHGYENFTGLKAKSAIGKRVSEVMPETEPEWFSTFGQVVISGNPITFEMFHEESEKDYSVYAYRSAKNEFTAIFEDVTIRKKTESSLIESKARFKALSEATYEAIFISDKGICIDANEAARTMFGYTQDELIGIFGTDVIADESKELVKSKMLAGDEKAYDAIALRKDGSKFFGEFQGKMFDYDGRKTRVTAVRDISERKNTEKLLKKRLDFIEFANRLSVGFINIDSEKIDEAITELLKTTSNFTKVDRAYVFLLSDDKKSLELSHEWCREGVISHRGILDEMQIFDFARYFDNLQKNINIEVHTDDISPTLKNKSIIGLFGLLKKRSFINLPMIVGGKFLGFVGFDTVNSRTEWSDDMKDSYNLCRVVIANTLSRNRAECELLNAKEKAEESDRLKSVFLNTMSHELRTPLNAVIGFSNMIANFKLSEEKVKYFANNIKVSGDNLLNIVNDIFDITLIETDEVQLTTERVSVNKIIDNIYSDFIGNEKIMNNYIELNIHKGLEKDSDILFTDLTKFRQIFVNLLNNAFKFTREGAIEYGYTIETIRGNSFMQFFVKDTGLGVPDDKKEIIFESFRQMDDTNTRKFGGIGLGLFISRKLVKLLGGTIWVESDGNNGSTFFFTIPFVSKEDISGEKTQIIKSKSTPSTDKTKILVVDDEEMVDKHISILLKRKGFGLLHARTGLEAIKLIKENSDVGLILMDIRMPEMNGNEATRRIREFNKKVVIIAHTAYDLPGDREKAYEAGCDDYFSKPISEEILFQKIVKFFGRLN